MRELVEIDEAPIGQHIWQWRKINRSAHPTRCQIPEEGCQRIIVVSRIGSHLDECFQLPHRTDEGKIVQKTLIILIEVALMRKDQDQSSPHHEAIFIWLICGKLDISEDNTCPERKPLGGAIERARVVTRGSGYDTVSLRDIHFDQRA